MLKAGQWVEVVKAPAWPFLVGQRCTVKEAIERSRLGGTAYLLNLYSDGDAPFLAKADEIRPITGPMDGG